MVLQQHYSNAVAPRGSCFSLIMACASCHMDNPTLSPCPPSKELQPGLNSSAFKMLGSCVFEGQESEGNQSFYFICKKCLFKSIVCAELKKPTTKHQTFLLFFFPTGFAFLFFSKVDAFFCVVCKFVIIHYLWRNYWDKKHMNLTIAKHGVLTYIHKHCRSSLRMNLSQYTCFHPSVPYYMEWW